MNEFSSNGPGGRMLSDEQMDGLLSEFFRLETPVQLNQPFVRSSGAVLSKPVLNVAAERSELTLPVQRNRRFVVVTALAVLALSVVVMLQSQENGISTGAPVADTAGQQDSPESTDQSTMNVSKGSDDTVGEDGTTLKEIDGSN